MLHSISVLIVHYLLRPLMSLRNDERANSYQPQAGRQAGRQTDRQAGRQADTDRQTQTGRHRQADTDRQTDRQTETETDRYGVSCHVFPYSDTCRCFNNNNNIGRMTKIALCYVCSRPVLVLGAI